METTKLPQKAIEEFKQIYFKKFGKTISDSEADKMGSSLLELFYFLLTGAKPKVYNDTEVINKNNSLGSSGKYKKTYETKKHTIHKKINRR